ncbi:amino acid adenylation domain-containing protein [Frankia sp. CcWB3]
MTVTDQFADAVGRTVRLVCGLVADDADPEAGSRLADLGLSSLATARLLLDLEAEFGREVALADLVGCETVADLARLVGDAPGSGARPLVAKPAQRYEPFPLTPVQEAYVVGKYVELGPDAIGCHHYREFWLPELDADRLVAAWRRLVAHHDALRLVAGESTGQRVRPDVPEQVAVVHDGPVAVLGAQARRRLSHRRYPPGAFPPFALEVVRDGGAGSAHLSLDGTAVDAHSTELLFRQWLLLYREPGARLPEPALSVRDCAVALAERRHASRWEADLLHWRERLSEVPPGPDLLLGERTAPPEPPDGLAHHLRVPRTGHLDPGQWQALRRRASALGVSPSSLALTVFCEVLTIGPRPWSLVLTTTDRVRLGRGADDVAGPFTSTCLLVVDEVDRRRSDLAAALHRQVWDALAHNEVSGVEVVRELRRADLPAPDLPAVFTSLLDVGEPDAPSMTDHLVHAVGQTSGVGLDHLMWEHGGGLRWRWDTADALFSRFVAALQAACVDAAPTPGDELNDLQQAYHVARVSGRTAGCQLYQSFHVAELDVSRLEQAWLDLVVEHDVLRTVVDQDGRTTVLPPTAAGGRVPVVESDQPEVDEAIARDVADRPFPLGRAPHTDLRVRRGADGSGTVHLAIDLLVADAPSVLALGRALLRRYADPPARTVPPAARASATNPAHREHWLARLADLPSGPFTPGAPGRTERLRFTADPAALRTWAARHDVTADAALPAAFCDALAHVFDPPFALPVVRWAAGREVYRPGEQTALSWVRVDQPDLPLPARARRLAALLAEDAEADGASGLADLRVVVLRRRRDRSFALPVVFTSVLDVSGQPLPPGVTAGPWRTATSDVSLDCVAVDDGETLDIAWDVVPGHLPADALDPAFDRFRATVTGFADQPDEQERVGRLTADERRRVLYEWNDTTTTYPADGPVHLLLEEQARRRPRAVALRWRDGIATYRELNGWANVIAHRLRERGVTAETAVAVATRRGPEMVAAVFGVLKAGGAYLPVLPGLPPDRAAAMLARTSSRVVLTTVGALDWRPDVPVVELDTLLAGADEDPGDPEPVTGPDNTAYYIFTSGSTGRPKCVAVTHRPVWNLLNWCYRTFGFGPGDVGVCVTSLGFDLSVFDILGLLGRGASLYVADEREQRDPELLADVLAEQPITFWNSAPTSLATLLPSLRDRAGVDLRLVFLSGDYTPLSLPADLRAVSPRASLVSLGGATEATVRSNWFPVEVVDPRWRSIPYGRPIDNSRYYVLDETLEPCPIGEEGDLYIAGDCLSLGYHGDPELTARSFLPDPFTDRTGERMYRTGDRAAFRPDGIITFLGRRDGQIKIRGFRVELGEIEHRLREHPAVREAVVLARANDGGDRKLVAYLQAEPGAARPEAARLRAFAAETLPDYMVPNFVVFVASFPATANGKLDRDALPWPVGRATSTGGGIAADAGEPAGPNPPVEHRTVVDDRAAPGVSAGHRVTPGASADELAEEIAALLAEYLGVPSVDPARDLWDQGATSFTMVRLSTALRERHGVRVQVSALLADPSARGIAAYLAREKPSALGGPGETEVEFFSPEDRARFKAGRRHLRPTSPDEPATRLGGAAPPARAYRDRATRRDFTGGSVTLDALRALLGSLRSSDVDGRPRRLYPSAGDTYAVQVYLHVRPNGVKGLAPGIYYHRPDEHVLQRVHEGSPSMVEAHFQYNREVFDRAGFELYLISEPRGIEPLYAEESELYLALEAGYVSQLLMTAQAEQPVGLCPIGAMAFDSVREHFRLHPGQRLLHSFLGGAVDRSTAGNTAVPAPRVEVSSPRPAAGPVSWVSTGRRHTAEVAATGMAGRYPEADDVGAFWRNLRAGRRSVGPVPPARAAALRDGFEPPHGGFLTDVTTFDALPFRISPREAELLDPQVRLLLPVAWQALEEAGLISEPRGHGGPRVGVYVAVMWHDHRHVGEARWRAGAPALVAAAASDLPARLAHAFRLRGLGVAVDTSCSSSLTAAYLAVTALRAGECDAALVCGVNLVTHPYHLAVLRDLGLSTEVPADGAFAADGAGWSPGEGAGALVLRPLADAREDGDVVHGVIEAVGGGGVGGRGRFGVPDSDALAESVREVLGPHGLCGADISYVECGGSGAPMADAAELAGLLAALRSDGGGQLAVGTVKPNIGHLEAAAGMSQLTKALLQLRHGTLAPTLVSTHRTPLVDWDDPRLELVDSARPALPGRVLVNAVGAVGSFGHVVLRPGRTP